MSFEEVLLEAIDEAFSMLGESAKKAIYYQLEKTFMINREDIPYTIEEFSSAIEVLFGAGAKIVETMIMRCLYMKTNTKVDLKQKDLTFTEYIAAAKAVIK